MGSAGLWRHPSAQLAAHPHALHLSQDRIDCLSAARVCLPLSPAPSSCAAAAVTRLCKTAGPPPHAPHPSPVFTLSALALQQPLATNQHTLPK